MTATNAMPAVILMFAVGDFIPGTNPIRFIVAMKMKAVLASGTKRLPCGPISSITKVSRPCTTISSRACVRLGTRVRFRVNRKAPPASRMTMRRLKSRAS